jgi:hypothetical protein
LQTAVVRGVTAINALYLAKQSYEVCCPTPNWYSYQFIGTGTLVNHLPGNTWKYARNADFVDWFSDSSLGGIHWCELRP